MNPEERLNLQRMIAANDVTDQTDNIRKLKHADRIWEDVKTMTLLKRKYSRLLNSDLIKTKITNSCRFLFDNYTDIFNKLYKDQLNVQILYTFIQELKNIENGKTDQHEASFKIGKLLKELYIDSALKQAEKHDKKEKKKVPRREKKISWDQFKKMNSSNQSL